MNIIARRTLRVFWEKHPQAQTPLSVLYNRLKAQDWIGPHEIRQSFGNSVDFVGDNRVIFDVGGNKYRVIVAFDYDSHRGYIKFVGTHAEYDRIDARMV